MEQSQTAYIEQDNLLVARRSFQLMGALLLLLVPAFIFVAFAFEHREVQLVLHLRVVFVLGVVVFGMTVTGVGLLYMQRWAAFILSFATLAYACSCVKDLVQNIVHPQGSIVVLEIAYVFAFTIPSILTTKNWRLPVWRRSGDTSVR